MTVGLIAEDNSNGGNNGIIVADNSLLNANIQQINVSNVGIEYSSTNTGQSNISFQTINMGTSSNAAITVNLVYYMLMVWL